MKPGPQRDQSKQNEAVRLFCSGSTLQEIADKFSITRQAVYLLIKRAGLSAKDGGCRLATSIRRQERAEANERRCFDKYGLSVTDLAEARRLGAVSKFVMQRKNARTRGIGWSLTFGQWWDAWRASGHWEERGLGYGYVMARNGDIGPYSVGNIYFCTSVQNIKDSHRFKGNGRALA